MPVFDCAIPCAESSAEKSEFDTDAAAAYTRSQTLEAGKFAVFIGGKRIPVREQLRCMCRRDSPTPYMCVVVSIFFSGEVVHRVFFFG